QNIRSSVACTSRLLAAVTIASCGVSGSNARKLLSTLFVPSHLYAASAARTTMPANQMSCGLTRFFDLTLNVGRKTIGMANVRERDRHVVAVGLLQLDALNRGGAVDIDPHEHAAERRGFWHER